MAIDQVIATVNALLQDASEGLAPRVTALLALRGLAPDAVRTDPFFDEWLLAGKMHPAGAPRVLVRPQRTIANQVPFPGNTRRADVALVVQFRYFAAEVVEIERAAGLYGTALLMALDGLDAYSRAQGGTVMDLHDPITIDFGTFDGTPTSGGWEAAFTLLEDSAQ